MRVIDVMTRDVLTVGVTTHLKEAARLLAERGISGLPVVDDDKRVVGVLSEGDIVVQEAAAGAPRARLVGEAMTAPAITITRRRPISKAARIMVEEGVNRLPVVDDDGSLVGIVTRADLVHAYVRSDEEIVAEIREDVLRRTLWIDSETIEVEVEEGDVRLAGAVVSKSDAELIPTFVERVPGVVSVLSKLTWPEEPSPRSPAAPGRSRNGRARRVFRA